MATTLAKELGALSTNFPTLGFITCHILIEIMESRSFSEPHSCEYCRKLVLASPDATEDGQEMQMSQRVTDWLNNVMGSTDYNRRRLMDGVVTCDFTLGEVKQAADDGCRLCDFILKGEHCVPQEISKSSFLAAFVNPMCCFFGIPKFEKHTSTGIGDETEEEIAIRVRPLADWSHLSLQLISVAGKLEKVLKFCLQGPGHLLCACSFVH